MAPPIESLLHLGFRFTPTPKEVITYYLPRLLAGEPMHAAIAPFIHDTNIYASAPGVLAGQFIPTPRKDDRFFFTTVQRQKSKPGKDVRYVRAAGPAGSWIFQKSEDVMDGDGVKVGEVRKLRYKFKSGAYADWLMEEYSCACSCGKEAVVGDTERVFCRIYVSPNAGADSAARQESAAFVEQTAPAPPPEPVLAIAHAQAKNKRPAPPPIIKPPCPKRIRGAPVSPIRPPPAVCTTPFAPPPPLAPHSGMAAPSAAHVQTVPAPRRPSAPSQQQAHVHHVPEAAAARPLLPRPHPVEQLPLTPRPAPAASVPDPFAPHDQLLSMEIADPAEDDGAFHDELMKELDKIPTEEAEDVPLASEAAVVKQEVDDDLELYANSLNQMLDVVPADEQKEHEHKEMDPFAAACKDLLYD